MSDWLTLKDQLNLTIRPIDAWPGTLRASWARETSPYSAGVKDTLRMLKTCLNDLNATQIVLQVAFREGHLRLDGLPRSGATAEHPGVILAFVSKHGPLRMAFDRFTHWHANLRAIAFHLDHLRLAGLYGVGSDGEQYRGWKALPPGTETGATGGVLTVEAALECLFAATGASYNAEYAREPARVKGLIRLAQAKTHPDTGGDVEEFQRVMVAATLLKEALDL